MLKQNILVHILTTVGGPNGKKLKVGETFELEDNAYTRLLLKSGTVELIDPPSLDLDFLEENKYELQDGHSYDELKKVAAENKAAVEKKAAPKKTVGKLKKRVEPVPGPDTYLSRTPKPKASEDLLKTSSEGEVEGGEEGHPEAQGEESHQEQPLGSSNEPSVEAGEEGHPEARGEEPAE